jgi:hypothetical protein
MAQVPCHERNSFDQSALREGGIIGIREFHHFAGPHVHPGRLRSNRGKHVVHVRRPQPKRRADQDLGIFPKNSFIHDRDDRACS